MDDARSGDRLSLRIAACQTPEILGDVDAAVGCIRDFAARAAEQDADVVLFPECFLQGYLVERAHLAKWGMGLDSAAFADVAERLRDLAPTLVFGIIERGRASYLNTAVVLEKGRLRGAYRKTHLTSAEHVFEAGDSYPVFDQGRMRFGVNICFDANFADAAAAVAAEGADVLLLPAQNMMRRENAEIWEDRHNEIRAERARETGMWVVSADVTGSRDSDRIGWGPTAVIDPSGDVVSQVPRMETGLVVAEIPARARGGRTEDPRRQALNSPGRGWIQPATS